MPDKFSESSSSSILMPPSSAIRSSSKSSIETRFSNSLSNSSSSSNAVSWFSTFTFGVSTKGFLLRGGLPNLGFILIYLALFPSIGSYYCWAGAVSIIGANRAGIFLSLIPLFSTILAMIFFDEKFYFFHFIGSVLIVLGLFLSNRKIKNA